MLEAFVGVLVDVHGGAVVAELHAHAGLEPISIDDAFELMREYSRRNHHRLSDVAHTVVTDPTRYPELTAT